MRARSGGPPLLHWRSAQRGRRSVAAALPILIGPAILATHLFAAGGGRILELYPSTADATCQEQFVTLANGLKPGDELVLHGGTYSQSCRRRLTNLHGTMRSPIVIRAADGETAVLTRPARPNHDYPYNNLEIEDSSYLVLKGLHLRGGTSGLRFLGRNNHITVERTEIFATGNNGLALNDGDSEGFVIRGNHIHHTGLLARSVGTTEGEGLYIGCNNGACVAAHHAIVGNYIHHLRGTSAGGNDGIEIKPGAHDIVVRDNVIHDTTIGTRYPCIFVYGGGAGRNIVEGNTLWRCGEAIQVVADAVIRNNLVLQSDVGVTAAPHRQVPTVKNVTIVNNTIYGHRECLRIQWDGARDVVLANNAIYCPGATAVEAAGLSGPGKSVVFNFVEGRMAGAAVDQVRFVLGGSAATTFADLAQVDLWPRAGSALVGTGSGELAPPNDFNGTPRRAPYDVGAYQTNGRPTNPGWRIGPDFKPEPTGGGG